MFLDELLTHMYHNEDGNYYSPMDDQVILIEDERICCLEISGEEIHIEVCEDLGNAEGHNKNTDFDIAIYHRMD